MIDQLFRKKKFDATSLHSTKLARVLDLFDIVSLGVSCTIGGSIYIIVLSIIANYTGPSIVLSFLLAGIATVCAGLSYAEIGARVPKSGSAYTYIYVTIGELVAFVLGWDLILEYLIGVSSVGKGLSIYIDSLFDFKIKKLILENVSFNFLNKSQNYYPDFLGFFFMILITVILITGVKESTRINKIACLINLAIIMFVILLGSSKVDLALWNVHVTPQTTWIDIHTNTSHTCSPSKCGNGGFIPFGVYGIIQGASKAFFAYIGFDSISASGEEVRNPQRSIPLAIFITIGIVTVVYVLSSAVLSLLMPFYMINTQLPIVQVFDYVGYHWANMVVSTGALISLGTCLFLMYPPARVIYSMADDGLLFEFLSRVSNAKTPINSILTCGIISSLLTLLFDLEQLVDMMSIGTLFAFSTVSICVVILRFRPDEIDYEVLKSDGNNPFNEKLLHRIFKPSSECDTQTSIIANRIILLSVFDIVLIVFVLNFISSSFLQLIGSLLLLTVLFILLILLGKQPQNQHIRTYKLPLVTFIPFLGVTINIFLMATLSIHTWLRFFVWLTLGLVVYFTYSYRHSKCENDTEISNELH